MMKCHIKFLTSVFPIFILPSTPDASRKVSSAVFRLSVRLITDPSFQTKYFLLLGYSTDPEELVWVAPGVTLRYSRTLPLRLNNISYRSANPKQSCHLQLLLGYRFPLGRFCRISFRHLPQVRHLFLH